MSDNLSDYLELKLLEHSVGKTAFTMPSHCFLALYTAAPSDGAGSGTEVSGGSYARVETNTSWSSASAGSITTSADLSFPAATADWGTVTDIALHDASTGGNMLWHGPLTSPKAIANGDIFKMIAGALTITLG